MRLGAGETIPQMEASLRVAEGGGQVRGGRRATDRVGEEARMLFTFTDLEPRKKAEGALRKSEERFAKAFRMAPVPSLVLYGDDLQALDINQAFSETFGYRGTARRVHRRLRAVVGGAERLGEAAGARAQRAQRPAAPAARDRNGLTAWSRPRR